MRRYLVAADVELRADSAGDAEGKLRSLLAGLMLDGDIDRAYVDTARPFEQSVPHDTATTRLLTGDTDA